MEGIELFIKLYQETSLRGGFFLRCRMFGDSVGLNIYDYMVKFDKYILYFSNTW